MIRTWQCVGLRRAGRFRAALAVLLCAVVPAGCGVLDLIPSEGSPSHPVTLHVGEPHQGHVAGLPLSGDYDSSFYRFTATLTGQYTISINNNDQDLGWILYSDPGFSARMDQCDQHGLDPPWESCRTIPTLVAGQVYYLEVHNNSLVGSVYTVLVQP